MTNKEIDIRLKALADCLPFHYEKIKDKHSKIECELELLNMSMIAIFAMLGEIAKRLPEIKE